MVCGPRRRPLLLSGYLLVSLCLLTVLYLSYRLPSSDNHPLTQTVSYERKAPSLPILAQIQDPVRNDVAGDSAGEIHLPNLIRGARPPPSSRPGFSLHKPPDGDFWNLNPNAQPPQQRKQSQCTEPKGRAHIQMSDVYDVVPFDNPDGGVWKQGWDITYERNQWNSTKKLKVIVVPHSHNDPGWLKTFEQYFLDQTKHILDLAVKKLAENKRMTFIWAEISYLSLWWSKATGEQRRTMKRLIENGQLEIVTGGWVMTDEAAAHYSAMLEQMIEGHDWMVNHVGVKPTNGWAIDPFGMSPTTAYLLKRMGLRNMVIQRIHYSLKKYLGQHRNLEFLWRQPWDAFNDTDLLCHAMPFFSYDVPHTCGPDPKICCQFDFKRLPGGKIKCPWQVPPQPITKANVHQRATMLLDQYRKKAQLYPTNVVLIPLGDDFRYTSDTEWNQQMRNYGLLFDYMNQRDDWDVEARFGTLVDYFSALRSEFSRDPDLGIPSLSGDFFTYADRDDHYWTGYFTSRPFYKSMDRTLEAYLRGGEILFSLMLSRLKHSPTSPSHVLVKDLLEKLVFSRRSLGLFQHHDAVAGTARTHVMEDYASRMLVAIGNLQLVIGQSAAVLLSPDEAPYDPYSIKLDLDDYRAGTKALPRKTVIAIAPGQDRIVYLYNSLGQRRREVTSLLVSSPNVCIYDRLNELVSTQLNPVWDADGNASPDRYELYFVCDVAAVGLSRYVLRPSQDTSCLSIASVKAHNTKIPPKTVQTPFMDVSAMDAKPFSLKNSRLTADFTEDGLLKAVTLHDSEPLTVNIVLGFVRYDARGGVGDKSGAYLFLPSGMAEYVSILSPYYLVISGPIISEVQVHLPNVQHRILLKESPGVDSYCLEILNNVDISSMSNFELAMRLETSVHAEDFFADSNGFQILRRRSYEKLPIQGNFYPVTSVAYMEDERTRISLAFGQSLGAASLQPGWLEAVLDRRLSQDDNRGLLQPVTDNVPALSVFRLMVERRLGPSGSAPGSVSPLAHRTLMQLVHPVMRLIPIPRIGSSSSLALASGLRSEFSPLRQDLPSDVHLLNLRTMASEDDDTESFAPKPSVLLLLHRVAVSCSFPHPLIPPSDGSLWFGSLFPGYFEPQFARQTSLSLLYPGENFNRNVTLFLRPMEIYGFELTR